jgi:raffinose/stachyose/melibiose transport system substrate-binding protein
MARKFLVLGIAVALVGFCFISFGFAGSKKSVTLQMWHWAANKEASWSKIIEDYEKMNPNIIIKQRVIPIQNYRQTLTSAQISGQGPDILHAEPAGDVFKQLKNKAIIDLTPYFDSKWKKAFYPAILKSFQIDGRFYSVSMAANNMQVFYNVDAFEKCGIKLPIATLDELSAAVEKLKAGGEGGISFRGADVVQMSHWFTVYARQMYPKEFKAADEGKGSFNIPQFVNLTAKLNKFFNSAFVKGVVGLSEDPARTLFTSGKASMYITGNWAIRSVIAEKPQFKVGVFQIPALTTKYKPTSFGSLAGTWCVSSRTKNKKEAIAFLKWATMNRQWQIVKDIGLCPAGPDGEKALADTPNLTKELAKHQAESISRDGFNAPVRDEIGADFQGMIIGELTPADVMRKAQEVKMKAN